MTFYSGMNNRFSPITDNLEKLYAKAWREDILKNNQFVYSENPVEYRVDETYTRYDKRFIHCKDNLIPIYLISLLCGIDCQHKYFLKQELSTGDNIKVMIELNTRKWTVLSGDAPEMHREKVFSALSFVLDYFENKEEFMKGFYRNIPQAALNGKFIISIDNIGLLNV